MPKNKIKIIEPKKIKIWNHTFFEEYEQFRDILKKFETKKSKVAILDLWCWNWRMNLLIKDLLKWNKMWFDFLWVDSEQSAPQFSEEFLLLDIENSFSKLEDRKFDLIILSWIFTNFLEFTKKNILKIQSLLSKDWIVFISLWNYWGKEGFWRLYRSEEVCDLEKFVDLEIVSVLSDLKFKYEIIFYKKSGNKWFNIVLNLNF